MSVVLAWGISAALAAPVTAAPATAPSASVPVAAPAPVAPASAVAPAPAPVASSVAPAPVVAPAVVAPPALTPTQMLAEGRLLEAALEFEDAWRTGEQPADLLGAAKAREAMGHRGHAASYLRELSGRGHGDADVMSRLAALERELVAVKIVVTTPEPDRDLVVKARYRGRAADARPDLVFRTPPGRARTVEVLAPLDPGKWELWIEDEYFTESRKELTVTAGVAPGIQLEPVPRDPPSAHAKRMASPILLLGVGIGLIAGGQMETKRVLRRSDVECVGSGWPCRDLMGRGVSLRSAGAGLLGASVGMAAAHLVQLSPKRRVRRAVWTGEAALGLVGVIAGSVGVALSASAYNNLDREVVWSDADFRADMQRATTHHTVAAFFLGVGAGMLVRSMGYLFDTRHLLGRARRDRSERKGPIALSPTSLGGVLTARF